MSHEAELTFRAKNNEDLNFILDSWGSSYYQGSSAVRLLSPGLFHSSHRQIREHILLRQTTKVLVCVALDDPWLIVGWICTEEKEGSFFIHYLYVKDAFKKEGISKDLLTKVIPDTGPVIITHMTYAASKILGNNYPFFQRFKYVPHAI